MNLVHIAEGWAKYLEGTAGTQALMKKRLVICDSCPNKVQVSPVGKVFFGLLSNDGNNLFKCNLCQCPLGALASLPTPGCKDGRWNNI